MTSMVGVDVGGTFTDIVHFRDGVLSGRKVPTTSPQADGVVAALSYVDANLFLHGTTAATNALLEGKGSRVALITDEGYEDLIEIGRQERPSLYDSSVDRPPSLVPRSLRLGFSGDRETILSSLVELEPEIVAVGLIDSYLDHRSELEMAASIEERLGTPALASASVSPEFREYERLATTVLTAYLTPSVSEYLAILDQLVEMPSRLIMTSSGGLIPFSEAGRAAGRLVLSGPAGGAVASAALGSHHGHHSVLSFDMGGTSTDVSRITSGALAVGTGHHVGGYVNRVPSIPIRTIGAGGGSIAWADAGGSLRVGPHSAGSTPGPAAYGLGGTDPTVTDANLVAGNIPSWLDLGGTVVVDSSLSEDAIAALANELGLSASETASGILEVVDSHMEHALRSVSIEEGADPRQAVLVAFGGAGGLHATKLARRLGMPKVLVPPLSGVFSALGLLLSSPRADTAQTVMLAEGDSSLSGRRAELIAEAAARFDVTFSERPTSTWSTGDVRYVGQSHELEVPAADSWQLIRAGFEEAHEEKFGFRRPDEPIEVVNLRAVAVGTAPIEWSDLPKVGSHSQPRQTRGAWERSSLPAGFEAEGPCLVVETNGAVRLGPGDSLIVLDDGTLELTLD